MKHIAVLALAGLAAAPALADGFAPAPVTPPVIAPASDWSGAYVGLAAGAGTSASTAGERVNEHDGDYYGLFAGYNYDLGKAVIGAELSYTDIDLGFADVDNSVTRLMVRAGYDAGRVMPYMTLGAAFFDLDGGSDTGFAYGLGVDMRAGAHVIIGAQYVHEEAEDFAGTDQDVENEYVQLRVSYKF